MEMFEDEKNHDQGALTSGIRNRTVVQGVRRRWLLAVVILGLLISAVFIALYIRSERKLLKVEQQLQQTQTDPAARAKEENRQLIEQVSKLIILPKDELPTIATVTDLSKLKDQPFFAQAQLGDKVLIYSSSKKAILYRPSSNVIVELAPLNSNNSIESGSAVK